MSKVLVLVGAGMIGQAITRRVGAGMKLLIADKSIKAADSAAELLRDAGFDVDTAEVDIASRTSIEALVETATRLGPITHLIQAAGVSPSQASPADILQVDLYGTAVLLETFGNVIAEGGSAVVIASQSGHRLHALSEEDNKALALTPADKLLELPILAANKVTDTLLAYQLSKRANALRVAAEAARWGKRHARVNAISPGIIITPLARDELNGPRGEGYRTMLAKSPAGRAGTSDEVAQVAALLLGADGAFINGSDFLMDGGVTASWFYGDLAPK